MVVKNLSFLSFLTCSESSSITIYICKLKGGKQSGSAPEPKVPSPPLTIDHVYNTTHPLSPHQPHSPCLPFPSILSPLISAICNQEMNLVVSAVGLTPNCHCSLLLTAGSLSRLSGPLPVNLPIEKLMILLERMKIGDVVLVMRIRKRIH